jgi:hypothetical protein
MFAPRMNASSDLGLRIAHSFMLDEDSISIVLHGEKTLTYLAPALGFSYSLGRVVFDTLWRLLMLGH